MSDIPKLSFDEQQNHQFLCFIQADDFSAIWLWIAAHKILPKNHIRVSWHLVSLSCWDGSWLFEEDYLILRWAHLILWQHSSGRSLFCFLKKKGKGKERKEWGQQITKTRDLKYRQGKRVLQVLFKCRASSWREFHQQVAGQANHQCESCRSCNQDRCQHTSTCCPKRTVSFSKTNWELSSHPFLSPPSFCWNCVWGSFGCCSTGTSVEWYASPHGLGYTGPHAFSKSAHHARWTVLVGH